LCKAALIDAEELIGLEAEFLQRLEYDLYIEENDFLSYKCKLNSLQMRIESELEAQEAKRFFEDY